MGVQNSKEDVRELIISVRNGDENAFASLLEQYRPLIDASIARFNSDESFSLYREDLRQEARPGDLVLTVGAGDVYRIGESLVSGK